MHILLFFYYGFKRDALREMSLYMKDGMSRVGTNEKSVNIPILY